jgi:hypothetical protein
MALRHLAASTFATAILTLLAVAPSAAAASGDLAATGTYVVSKRAHVDGFGTLWFTPACVTQEVGDLAWPTVGACDFVLGESDGGRFTVTVHDEALGDIPFAYPVMDRSGAECAFEAGVTSATVTITEWCWEVAVVPDLDLATVGTVTLREA